jgi:hypothetical protein
MPNDVTVWVDRQVDLTAVYVDQSLYGPGGNLTAVGMAEVNRALSDESLGWFTSPQSNGRPVLRAVAG